MASKLQTTLPIHSKPASGIVIKPPILKRPSPVPGPSHPAEIFTGPFIDLNPTFKFDAKRHGTKGTEINVSTNFLKLELSFEKIYEYSMHFEPIVRSKFERQQIFEAFKCGPPLNGKTNWAVDVQCKTLWTLKPIVNGKIGARKKTKELEYKLPNGKIRTSAGIELEYARLLNVKDASEDVSDMNATAVLRGITGLVSQKMMQYTGRQVTQTSANRFFFNAGSKDIGGLLATRGYFISARPGEAGILYLNINTATSIFFDPMVCLQWISKMLSTQIGMSQREVDFALRRKRVRITYDRPRIHENVDPNAEENRRRTIQGKGQSIETQEFSNDSGRHKVWRQYTDNPRKLFASPDESCLNVGQPFKRDGDDSKAVFIPARFLELEHQLFTGTLTANHVAEVIKFACRKPAENANMICNEGMKLLGIRDDKAGFGEDDIKIGQSLSTIKGRLISPPHLTYSASKAINISNASWNLRGANFCATNPMEKLKVVQICMGQSTVAKEDDLTNFRSSLCKTLKLHWKNGVKTPDSSQQDKVSTFKVPTAPREFRKELENKVKLLCDNDGTIIVFILPSRSVDLRAAYKKPADCKYGIKTISCLAEKIFTGDPKKNKSSDPGFLSNLAAKINPKNGGTNHKLRDAPLKGKLFDGNYLDTLILGADVTHPSQGCTPGCPSIAAVVGTVGNDFSLMPGEMRLQPARQEIIASMQEMVYERINAFAEKTKRVPTNIIMFRDGVSESQFQQVHDQEVRAIRMAHQRVLEDAQARGDHKLPSSHLKLSFYVVSKRHHARFYPQQKKDSDKGNVKPGLVVDRIITLPGKPNFYLQSHAALQGTARPAHYIEIVNGIGLSPDEIQELAHSLCYTYARATKGISYASPAYNADQLCERGRLYLREWQTGEKADLTILGEDPKARDRRVAAFIENSEEWRMWLPQFPDLGKTRRNPWHPKLDGTMFWV